MSTSQSSTARSTERSDASPAMPSAARRLVSMLKRLQQGALTVHWPNGETDHFGAQDQASLEQHASVTMVNWQPVHKALKSGDIGFAQAYIDGDWHTPDLAALLRLIIANRHALDEAIYGHWLGRLVYRLRHWMRRNHKANSAENIPAHYDLGNDFYAKWLDETMNYSSALFHGDFTQGMAQAQHAKVERALRAAGVQPGARVLEIGCGWGALAEMATQTFGAHVVGVTLSPEQLKFAQDRMQRLGLTEKADLRLQDYRDIAEQGFDAVCSIEMIEAVGQAYWPTYFEAIARALRSGGRACVQSIVIDDRYFERYLKGSDFIQQYIFPGGCLPSPSAFRAAAEGAGLQVLESYPFGPDYAETLRRWRADFMAQRAAVQEMGFDDAFVRTWEFYLAYCEAAFDEASIDVVQYTLVKP
jgi:cyclopropane-fatty-acyl-phospholipid synthase